MKPGTGASSIRRAIRRDNLRLTALLLPGVLLIGLFTLYPIVKMLIMSFFNWKIGFQQTSAFVGLKNYTDVFTDPTAGVALVNTLFYAAVTVPGQIVLGLLCAVLVHSVKRFSVTFRTLYYLPVITSWVVVALLFRYIFSNQGMLNYILTDATGLLSEPVRWLGTRWTAMAATTVLGIWKGIGWNMVIFLAALQAIPQEQYEAAAIDGMGAAGRFRHVTLPNIRGTVLFALVMLFIGAFNTYTPIAVITGGNPAHQTEVVLTWMYYQTFSATGKMGYAASLSFVVAAIVAAIAVVLFRVIRPEGKESKS